jgi:hypothetical protein
VSERTISFAGRPIVQDDGDEPRERIRETEVLFGSENGVPPKVSVTAGAINTSRSNIKTSGKDPFGDDNTFANASLVIPLDGSLEDEKAGIIGFRIPNENFSTLDIEYTPTATGNTNGLSINSGNLLSSRMEWTSADASQAQNVSSDFENNVVTMTSPVSVPTFAMTVGKLSQDETSWENVVRVSNTSLDAAGGMGLRFYGDGDQFTLSNTNNSAKTYSLTLSRVVDAAFDGLRIGAGASQTFLVSNWADLNKSGVTQLLDTNSDGKIDEVRQLRTETSVRGTANTPSSVLTSSVYPNPVTATSVLEYTLPNSTERVRIQVLNTLGQVVATLLDSPQQAGKQRVNLDAAALSSGAYFYRISTESLVETGTFRVVK